jgi:hygromycin-B 7''-O-kinase
VNGLAEARARSALAKAGLDPKVELKPLSSVTNEVWLAGDHVVRVNRHPVQRLYREAILADLMPTEVGIPQVVKYGGIIGADWTVVERIPGQILSRCWPSMSREQRRAAVSNLAFRLRHLHQWVCPEPIPSIESPQLLDSSERHPVERVVSALSRAQDLEHVDPVMILEAKAIVRDSASALEPFDQKTFVHGDLHFENVMWDGEQITAILDFEWSRAAPPDLELDVLLRFCAYPDLHVAEDYEHLTRAEDYADVPWWLAEDYPELFDVPRQLERMRIYAIAFEVREVLLNPPQVPPDALHPSHPYHRLQAVVAGRSHLDTFDNAPA